LGAGRTKRGAWVKFSFAKISLFYGPNLKCGPGGGLGGWGGGWGNPPSEESERGRGNARKWGRGQGVRGYPPSKRRMSHRWGVNKCIPGVGEEEGTKKGWCPNKSVGGKTAFRTWMGTGCTKWRGGKRVWGWVTLGKYYQSGGLVQSTKKATGETQPGWTS